MTLRVLAAPSASGKTSFCVQRVRQVLRDHPQSEIWVLVADGSQALQFRRLLAQAGGALGVQVVSFNNLLREILEINGQTLPLAPPALVSTFIQQSVEWAASRGDLSYYEPIRHMRGFIGALEGVFKDLKRGLVYPDAFLEYTVGSGQAIKEIALIYNHYQSRLQAGGWADPEGLSWLAVEFLEQHPGWVPGWPLLVLDGFDSFTRPQYEALSLLNERIPEILITLPGTPEMARQAHHRFTGTLLRLKKLGNDTLIETMTSVHLPSALKHLEACLFEPESSKVAAEGVLSFLEARSPAEEAREALRWMKSLIVREEIDLDSCAIIVPDLSLYRVHLKAVAGEFGLPLAFSSEEKLIETPLYHALLTLLQLSIQDFPRLMLLEVLRSPCWDFSSFQIFPQTPAVLDLVSQQRTVTGGRRAWLESLDALAGSSALPEPYVEELSEDVLAAPQLPKAADADRLRFSLAALFDRLQPGGENRSLVDWVGWLEDLLDDLKFWRDEQNTQEADVRSCIRQVLQDLVLAAQEAYTDAIDYVQFLNRLQRASEQSSLPRPPVRKPAVMVLHVLEGRGMRHQALAVMGLSEGVFPGKQQSDPFLDEKTRSEVDIGSAFDPYQASLFYQSVTRTGERLLLTRPYQAPDGEVWQPSPFWDAALTLFDEEPVKIAPEAPRPLDQAGSEAELMAWAAKQGKIPYVIDVDLQRRVERVAHGRVVMQARLENTESSPYNGRINIPCQLPEFWSASRLETYLACPHFYFSQNMLSLEPRIEPELGMDMAQRGLLLHKILERTYREAQDRSELGSILQSFHAVVDEELARAPMAWGFRPGPLWEYEKEEITAKLENTISALHEISEEWRPEYFELSFGFRHLPPLTLSCEKGSIQLRGLIDRVDRKNDGSLRIIDYKTGSGKQSEKDFSKGERLQLPLYVLAARDALKLGEVSEGFYWSINGGKPGGLRISKMSPENLIETVNVHVARVLEGMEQGEFMPAPPREGCPDYCPASGWCWMYQPGRRWR